MGRDKEMPKELKERCFMHVKYSEYTIPIDSKIVGEGDMQEEVVTRQINFRDHTYVTVDSEIIARLEARVLKDQHVIEIAPSRRQEAIRMVKNGEAQPAAIAQLLDINRVTKQ